MMACECGINNRVRMREERMNVTCVRQNVRDSRYELGIH